MGVLMFWTRGRFCDAALDMVITRPSWPEYGSANSARLSVHCKFCFDLPNLERVARNDDAKFRLIVPGEARGEHCGDPRFRNRNWMLMSSSAA